MLGPGPWDRLSAGYRDAWFGAIALPRPSPDAVVMGGSTRLDFLQRMSTNDISHFEPGQLRRTVLTTPLARIVDWVQVLARPDSLLLLTSPGRGATVVEWLRRYVLFGDNLTLGIDPGPRQSWLLLGPLAAPIAASLVPGSEHLAPGAWLSTGETLIWQVDQPGAGGWAILASPLGLPDLAQPSMPESIAAELYEVLRIEAGIPLPGREITEERIPLEVGLAASISMDKGCYIGQEIIARMASRDRLARRLVGVQLGGPAEPGVQLRQEATPVGHLTSLARSPRLGWIGLGLVRPAALAAHPPRVAVGASSEPAELVELPFPPASL